MATNCPPFEFLLIVKESAYGTQKTGTVSTLVGAGDAIYVRLAGANRFRMRPNPIFRKIQFGGGFAVPGYRVSDQMEVKGGLELELTFSQAALLLGWAFTRYDGSSAPWATTEPTCDLASCTVYHGIARDDGTIKRRRYKGVKVHNARLASSAASGVVTLTLDLQAQKPDGNAVDSSSDPDATAFPAPADTAFPVDFVLHVHTSGHVSVASSALSYLTSLELDVTNAMDPQYYASHFLTFDRLRGRTSKATAGLLYTATPDWRADFEALTTRAFSAAWTNGTNTITLDYQANNVVDSVADDLTPGKVYNQTVVWENQYDTSAGKDIAFTYA